MKYLLNFCIFSSVSEKGDKTPENVLVLLQAATAESEEKSENSATNLQGKEITIDEFLDQFMVERKLMHMRKLKIEKMAEMMKKTTNKKQINFYSCVNKY